MATRYPSSWPDSLTAVRSSAGTVRRRSNRSAGSPSRVIGINLNPPLVQPGASDRADAPDDGGIEWGRAVSGMGGCVGPMRVGGREEDRGSMTYASLSVAFHRETTRMLRAVREVAQCRGTLAGPHCPLFGRYAGAESTVSKSDD